MAPRVQVRLPRSLREFWDGPGQAEIEGETLADVVAVLNARWPGLGARVVDDQGRVRRHVHVFVNEDAVGHLEPARVALADGDTVHIVPALSGG